MKISHLRTDGFYHSGPVNWEDWHAGVHIQEIHYHYLRFYPNGNWICCHRYVHDFAFWEFTETLLPDAIEKGKRDGTGLIDNGLELFTAGSYVVQGDSLTTRFEWRVPLHPSGEQVFRTERSWQVLDRQIRAIGRKIDSLVLYFAMPKPSHIQRPKKF
jgi:hypothetical protein